MTNTTEQGTDQRTYQEFKRRQAAEQIQINRTKEIEAAGQKGAIVIAANLEKLKLVGAEEQKQIDYSLSQNKIKQDQKENPDKPGDVRWGFLVLFKRPDWPFHGAFGGRYTDEDILSPATLEVSKLKVKREWQEEQRRLVKVLGHMQDDYDAGIRKRPPPKVDW